MRRGIFTCLLALPGLALSQPKPVQINEVMVAPSKVDPAFGQWVELRNPGQVPVNLQGLVLQTLEHQHAISITNELVLEGGAILVLGRTTDSALNGGAVVGYSYGADILLDLQSDTISVRQGATVLDEFTYGPENGRPVKEGASFSLEPGSGLEWCLARLLYGQFDNKGTPGMENTFCDTDKDGFAEDEGDCDDNDPTVHPGAQETCNGRDDDCNGQTDDGVINMKCLAVGVCAGTLPQCTSAGPVCPYPASYEPIEKTCDGLDNDCDGKTDEDLSPEGVVCLSAGVCAGVAPVCNGSAGWQCPYPKTYEPQEVTCDGLDNDCDQETDEGFKVGEPCVVGVGACSRSGQWRCAADGKTAVCSAVPGEPVPERCDGLDNDCDGLTDEDFVSAGRYVGGVCQTGAGACVTTGKWRCSDDGSALVCSATPGTPTPEICGDGIDNDCNGWTDDCEEARGGGCLASRGARLTPFVPFVAALVLLRRRRSRPGPGPRT